MLTPDIDHPSVQSNLTLFDDHFESQVSQTLLKRTEMAYEAGYLAPGFVGLKQAILSASMHNASFRSTHEQQNLGLLNIPGSRDESVYLSLIGKPERIGELILFFSKCVSRLPANIAHHNLDSVTLELGGKSQFGDWDVTQALDNMALAIPSSIASLRMDSHIDILGLRSNLKKNYRYWLYEEPSSDFAFLRRQRQVANIQIGDLPQVNIRKESLAVIALHSLHSETRKFMDNLYDPKIKNEDNTPVTMVARNIFEQDASEQRNSSPRVYPINARYLISAPRPTH